MPVFKLCMKIIKKNLGSMLIYVVIFLLISIIISASSSKDQQKVNSFNQVKSNVAFIAEENSTLVDGFKQELGKIANFIDIPDETEKLQDALYFREVTYIIRIPKGFTESFMKGENAQIVKTVIPNSFSNAYIDLSINQYFNTGRLYVKQMDGISQESLVRYLGKDLAKSTPVELIETVKNKKDLNYSTYYFNYLAYSMLSVFILGIGAIMIVFNNSDLKKRNSCSPISAGSVNFQFMLANLIFTITVWTIMVGFCFILDYKNIFNLNTVYFLLNSFIFAICAASISYLVGNLIKSQNAISAANNVVTLGMSFLSGVFVPQELLDSTVLKIASFTPTYWYVKANNNISQLTQFDYIHLETALSYILIEAGFAAAFFAIALVVGKKKRLSY